MVEVLLRDGESNESLLARFNTAVQRAGILKDARNHRFFRSKGEKARIAARLGVKRAARNERIRSRGRR
ncbi:MAG: 30S ribosomal protein S21 [Dehalococcoidia bacterium]|nr:30S ribosomal protein S21 [Dehalococcoidia bacterium]